MFKKALYLKKTFWHFRVKLFLLLLKAIIHFIKYLEVLLHYLNSLFCWQWICGIFYHLK